MKEIYVVCSFKKGGGISKYVFDTYSKMLELNSKIKLTFIIEDNNLGGYEKELQNNNLKYIFITSMKKNPIRYAADWWNTMKKLNKKGSIIHFHYDALVRFWPFMISGLFNNNSVIVHSHNGYNDKVEDSFIKRSLQKIGKKTILKRSIKKLAVSKKAGEYLFGNSDFTIVKNGIKTSEFKFDQSNRNEIRKELNIEKEQLAFVNVGRLEAQKNHEFLLETFSKIKEENPSSLLFIIGTGSLEEQIKKQIKKLKLENNVKLLGYRTDVNKILSGMDVILFPSLYEGFPISLIEAQCNGLKIVYSDSIDSGIEIGNNIYSAKLNDVSDWIKKVHMVNQKLKLTDSEDRSNVTNISKYDISNTAQEMIYLYEKM